MNLKHKHFAALTAILLTTLTPPCGRGQAGKYQGIDRAIIGGNTMTQSARLELKESDSELVTGTWTSQTSSGTFQGFIRENRIDNIELQRSATGSSTVAPTTGGVQNPSPVYGGYNSDPCVGRYTGSLKVENDRIMGRLEWSTGFGLYNSGSIMINNGCTAIEIDASKLSD